MALQAFLELSVLHPEWLQQFLLDSEEEVPLVPRRWAVDMITWSFETAAKRVSGALSQHVSHFILLQQYMEPGAVPGQPTAPLAGLSAQDTRVVEQIANQAQLVLSPLASAVLAFVDKVVLLVRDCVPPRRGGRDQGNQLLDPPEVPADAVRVLHKYAALGPWAAAHLMLVSDHHSIPQLAPAVHRGDAILGGMRQDWRSHATFLVVDAQGLCRACCFWIQSASSVLASSASSMLHSKLVASAVNWQQGLRHVDSLLCAVCHTGSPACT